MELKILREGSLDGLFSSAVFISKAPGGSPKTFAEQSSTTSNSRETSSTNTLKLKIDDLLRVFSPSSFSKRGSYFKYRVSVRKFCKFVLEGLSGRVSSEAPSDVCMGQGSQILIGFGGVLGRALSDVCMGEGLQILIGFGGLSFSVSILRLKIYTYKS